METQETNEVLEKSTDRCPIAQMLLKARNNDRDLMPSQLMNLLTPEETKNAFYHWLMDADCIACWNALMGTD